MESMESMTLSKYREPDYSAQKAYESGLEAKTLYGHNSSVMNNDNNSRMQVLYSKKNELESKIASIDSKINAIQTSLEQTKEYRDDPLYRTARDKYISTGDNSGLIQFRNLQEAMKTRKANEELNKTMREQSKNASIITLQRRADEANQRVKSLPDTIEGKQQKITAQNELDEALLQLANLGVKYTPKEWHGSANDSANGSANGGASTADLGGINAEIDGLADGKFTESDRKKLMDKLAEYEAKLGPNDSKSNVIAARNKLNAKKSIEQKKQGADTAKQTVLDKVSKGKPLSNADRKVLKDNGYVYNPNTKKWSK